MVPLAKLNPGETGLIGSLEGGHHFVSRLAALGFTTGALVTVIRNYGSGPILVSIRARRLLPGRGEAGRIGVHLPRGVVQVPPPTSARTKRPIPRRSNCARHGPLEMARSLSR